MKRGEETREGLTAVLEGNWAWAERVPGPARGTTEPRPEGSGRLRGTEPSPRARLRSFYRDTITSSFQRGKTSQIPSIRPTVAGHANGREARSALSGDSAPAPGFAEQGAPPGVPEST